jgi:solute carrier family 25 oxoglutarate transporter 11
MLVGAVQVGTYDQFRDTYRKLGITSTNWNVFAASMTSGIIYSIVTMPLETTKNRMAFQKPDPKTGEMLYKTTAQSLRTIVANEGLLRLWAGFPPYYLRCGGHTVAMFMAVDWLRQLINKK